MAVQASPRPQGGSRTSSKTAVPSPNGSVSAKPTPSSASDDIQDHNILNLSSNAWQALFGVTILAFFVRLFRIYQPSSVVFDEVHF
ncbi:Dolichyl-phosphate-mannose--protein mannosyltransferase 1, partial [Oleoguttula sp. CCFEE 5521]